MKNIHFINNYKQFHSVLIFFPQNAGCLKLCPLKYKQINNWSLP